MYAITDYIDVRDDGKAVIPIERTKKNNPALWEQGGGRSKTGEAVIIADPDGKKKRPLYIRKRGHLVNSHHALFVVREGDLVVEADHHRMDFIIRIWKISQFLEKEALLDLESEFSMGEWFPKEPPDFLDAVIEVARQKAICYHCKEPHYYIPI